MGMYILTTLLAVCALLAPPEPPANVRLSVASASSIQISYDEPLRHNGAVVTRYKGWLVTSHRLRAVTLLVQ